MVLDSTKDYAEFNGYIRNLDELNFQRISVLHDIPGFSLIPVPEKSTVHRHKDQQQSTLNYLVMLSTMRGEKF